MLVFLCITIIYYFLLYLCRWPIAIKTTRVLKQGSHRDQNNSGYSQSNKSPGDEEEIMLLMDEAKTMWKVGSYHENIVNLQGICVNVEEGSIRRVTTINLQSHFYIS